MSACEAQLRIADDYGDNHATCHCQLRDGHEGKHREAFRTGDATTEGAVNVVVEWDGDDRP